MAKVAGSSPAARSNLQVIRRPTKKGWSTRSAVIALGLPKTGYGQLKSPPKTRPYFHRYGFIHSTRAGELTRPRRWGVIDGQALMRDARRAYRRLALRLHPDRGGSCEQFQLATEAYHWLEQHWAA